MHDSAARAGAAGMRRGVLLGVDIGGTSTKFACYNPSTGALRRARLDTHVPDRTGPSAWRRLTAAASHFARLDDDAPLLGLGVALPGIVHQGRLLMADNVRELEGMDLREAFDAAFGAVATVMDNDVKAGALAECAWGALRDARQALYVNIGTGLAAAAIIDGRVYRGQHGAALEIGYQLGPDGGTNDSDAGSTTGGRAAPMQAQFSGAALDELARRLLGRAHTARDVFESTRPSVRRELQQRLEALGGQLVNLAIAFDVERIAIGGGVSRQYARFAGYLVQRFQRLVPFPPVLLSARFAYDASLWGALELARRAADAPDLPDSLFDAPADMEDVSGEAPRKATVAAGRLRAAAAPRGKGP